MANIGYIQVVRHCNQSCRFCSNPDTPHILDLDTAKRQIDDFVGRGYFGIILTGGEPSMSPIVPDITRYANDQGLHVRMITNGSRLSNRAFAEQVVEAGLRHFHLSLHSCKERVQDFLAGTRGSFRRAMQSLENIAALGVTADVNTVINRYNADHLDQTVRALTKRFDFLRHFVWNNLDPSLGRARFNRDTATRLADFELSLKRAMDYLHRTGRTFRVERVPLCYMVDYAHCSTETRKIIKGEERIVHFLDEKGTVRQTDFGHTKTETCRACSLEAICGGLFDLGNWYDPAELHAVFVPKEPIIERTLRD